MKVFFQCKLANTSVETKLITAINFTGFSGPDFWYFPRNLRNPKHHSSAVRTKVLSYSEFSDTVHIQHTLSPTDKKFYIWNADDENFYFKGTLLEKSTKAKKKLSKKVSCKFNGIIN